MQLDVRRRPVMTVAGLDHVGIQRALREESRILDPICLGLKDVDEFLADDLPLLLRIGNTRERVEKTIGCVDDVQIDLEVMLERAIYELALVAAKQSVIDENALKLLTDRAMQERRGDG